MSRTRQLAAIMFTDIKGYTALMQRNEQEAIQARDKHRRIFKAATEKYNGKILQYYGDGTLSIFDSAIDAVKCGIEMQRGFMEEPEIPVRIGIHTGDIFFSDEEIVGDSVNVASRVESLAVPGSVFISEKVYDEVKNQESIQTVRLKSFRMKNVEKPIEVYAVSNKGLVVPEPEELRGKTEEEDKTGKEKQNSPAAPAGAPFLATKLFIPPSRPNAVYRPRLIDRLNQGLHGKLTLVSAPAGFGKTTLISEWIANLRNSKLEIQNRSITWLSLDEADSTPNRFFSYLIAALQKIAEGVGENAMAMLQSPQPPPIDAVLGALLNELSTITEPFILVLDDYHLIDSPPIDQALSFLLDYLPPQIHLAIATREDPNLPLPRLRVRGQLTELRAADLRFTSAEAAEFLNQAMRLDLSEKDIEALENRTEGWIAGLQLAALSMQGRQDTSAFIHAFTGSHRFILDYLAEEVLNQQPEKIQQFLLQTSILEKLSASLCDAVTGRTDSREILESLERSNLFVIPLDDQRHWYRYHHLFGDVLRGQSQKKKPGELTELHQRASKWFEENELIRDAIQHTLKGKDFKNTVRLLELIWPEMDYDFQSAAWMKWVNQLPADMIPPRPVIQLGIAWSYLNEGNMEKGKEWLDNLGKTLENPPDQLLYDDEEQFRFLPASLATALAYFTQALGDLPGSVKYAQEALSLLPADDHHRRGPAAALLGLTHWARGYQEEAFKALSEAMENFQKVGSNIFALSGSFFLADIRKTQGRLREAEKVCERSLPLIKENGKHIRGASDLYLALSLIYYERNEIETALQHLRTSEELGEGVALPDWRSRLCIQQALFKELEGDTKEALQLLEEANRLYYTTPVPNTRPIPARIANLHIRHGNLKEARQWAKDQNLSPDDELTYLKEYELITFARLLLKEYTIEQKRESLEKALRLLQRLLQAAEKSDRIGSQISILTLLAIAFELNEKSEEALKTFSHALTLAEPEGFARIFLDEGELMIQLLAKAKAQGILPHYVALLLGEIDMDPQKKAFPAAPPQSSPQPLIEPLSDRELEILQLIAQGLSNQQICDRLYLALSTVKGHNRNIFDKLDVKRRTEAVAKAQELGLI
jgi:LuxR family maltose regulon positive regulatory protein